MQILFEIAYYFSSLALLGLIWTIQVVHYPSFKFITENQFNDFHKFHSFRISLIVVPLMLLELMSGMYLLFLIQSLYWFAHAALVVAIWLSTFLVSVPLHNQLQTKKDLKVIEKLVATNWIRTTLWSTKAALIILNPGFELFRT